MTRYRQLPTLVIFSLLTLLANSGMVLAQEENEGANHPRLEKAPAPLTPNAGAINGSFPRENSRATPKAMRAAPAVGKGSQNRKNRNQKKGPEVEIDLSFGADQNTPVFSIDFVGGFRQQQPEGFVETPALKIFPNGRIVTGRNSPNVKEITGQMDPVELRSFLVFATEDCRFFDFTTDSIKADIKKAADSMIIMDAATTQMTIHLDKHSQQTDIYALQFVARKMQQVQSVAAMTALSSRAQSIIANTKIGDSGPRAIAELNKTLAARDPDARKFVASNLQFAEQFVDGRVKASYNQEYPDGNETVFVYGSWEKPADGDAKVSVSLHRSPSNK